MTTQEQLQQDLNYVAGAVRRADGARGVAEIYFLWAAIVLVGFTLPDLAPQQAGLFWFTVGPLGGLLSVWLGMRADRQRGEQRREEGMREGLHWLVMWPAFVLTGLPMLTGLVPMPQGSAYFLLNCGIAYALAGVHLHRPLLWTGLLMMTGFAVLVWLRPPYVWTCTGVAVSAGLAWAGWQARGR